MGTESGASPSLAQEPQQAINGSTDEKVHGPAPIEVERLMAKTIREKGLEQQEINDIPEQNRQ
jgi:hypothetical protein